MQGVTTQVSKLHINTACTRALKNNLDTRGSAPSLLRILVILFHTALEHDKLTTTADQSSSVAYITRPRYQKELSISRGSP